MPTLPSEDPRNHDKPSVILAVEISAASVRFSLSDLATKTGPLPDALANLWSEASGEMWQTLENTLAEHAKLYEELRGGAGDETN